MTEAFHNWGDLQEKCHRSFDDDWGYHHDSMKAPYRDDPKIYTLRWGLSNRNHIFSKNHSVIHLRLFISWNKPIYFPNWMIGGSSYGTLPLALWFQGRRPKPKRRTGGTRSDQLMAMAQSSWRFLAGKNMFSHSVYVYIYICINIYECE